MTWIPADWPAPGDIVAGTTTRAGGTSTGVYESLNLGVHVGDDAAAVEENRRRFVAMSGLPREPEWLTQVHGSAVRIEGESPPGEADAMIARQPGAVVAVLTADCLPLLLCADDGSEIAAVHGGWRGLAAGIVAATLGRLATPPERLLAWLGPAISQPAFEVGNEVRQAFADRDPDLAAAFEPNDRGRCQADLYGIARAQLAAAGVAAVYGGDHCTWSEPERFFSYRRDGQCGRMASFVCRKAR